LSYEGITFYQSSFGSIPESVTFEILDKDDGSLGHVTAPVGKQVDIPAAPPRSKWPITGSTSICRMVRKPVRWSVSISTRPGAAPEGVWIFEEHPEMNATGYFHRGQGHQIAKLYRLAGQ